MRHYRITALFTALIMAFFLISGCSNAPEEEESGVNLELYSALKAKKADLDAKRVELPELEAQLAALGDEEELVEEKEALQTQVTTLETEIGTLVGEVGSDIVEFINSAGLLEGEEIPAEVTEAFGMKSSEDLVLAQEWIDKGGDYVKAIDIIKNAIMNDPDNEELKAALATAEADRFMNEERFAAAEKGMNADEIRGVLGQVNLRNTKEFPDKGVTLWMYKREDGGAAAVWFRVNKKTEQLEVYDVKFDYLVPKILGPDGEEEVAEEETAP